MNRSYSAFTFLKWGLSAGAILLMFASVAFAQTDNEPATQPATQPASQPAKGGMVQGKGMMGEGQCPMMCKPMMEKMKAGMKEGTGGHHRKAMLGRAPEKMKMHSGRAKAVPHLYHIGAKAFFLDQKELDLTAEQEVALSQLDESTRLSLATHHRQLEQAEQELWVLTGKKSPDTSSVEAKMKEIAELKTTARMNYFRTVKKAVDLLTEDQRTSLLEPAE